MISKVSASLASSLPARGSLPPDLHSGKQPFDSFPLSPFTLSALRANSFITATPVQRAALPHALAGRDILAAAKTGSGKTLAFGVPLVEALWRERWGPGDGLGAAVIAPTRELAVQIFEVLRRVGRNHSLSAGLITGGKREFREEQGSVVRMNVLVATPGRLLQHLEQTPGFSADALRVLVLDEADRILDLGFARQLDAILEYLPAGRQTMLFSATQTKSVRQLARLSLDKPEYISVNEKDEATTPDRLVQA
jgi:ATP-dependent RNA helicase DDX10/DBP4